MRSSAGFLPRRGARYLAMNSTLYQPKPMPSISVRNTFFSPRRVKRGSTHEVSDRKSTRLNSSHDQISYAVFCLKKKKKATSAQNQLSSSLLRITSEYHMRG